MKVVLPDSSELELPDGATGLDAAAAIGPKLAEQAVLVRSNGHIQDLRTPLEDGQQIQILTTRDTSDPDALYVLRHSTAHLLAEAVRRLYPGTKIAIGPPIENGFYYDFEFPEPISEEALERIEEEIRKELAEGRSWNREEVSAEEAKRFFAEQGEDYKVELVDTADGPITLYTQGEFTDLCRGPHLQDSKPIKAVKLTGLAGAYWRGDEHNTQLTRIYGTAFYSQADLDAYLERLEQARARDHRRLGPQLDLFHLSDHAPGMPFWHPKGMVDLERARGSPAPRERERGYVEVKTPLLYDEETYETSGHYRSYEDEHVLRPGPRRGRGRLGAEADELPRAHAALRQRTCAATATCRFGTPSPRHSTATSAAARCTGSCACGTSPRTTRTSSARAEQIEEEIFAVPRLRAPTSTSSSAWRRASSSRRARRTSSAPTRSGTSPRPRCAAALERRGIDYTVNEGDGAFYGPKIDLHMTDVLGRSWQMGTIQLDSQMPASVRPHLHGRRQRRAHAVRHPPRAASARSSASSGS